MPVKSRSMEEPSYESNHPPLPGHQHHHYQHHGHQRQHRASGGSGGQHQQQGLSPLGGLTGMLNDKMTFSSSNSTTTSLGHGEDSQSR